MSRIAVPIELDQVRQEELKSIKQRRRVMGLEAAALGTSGQAAEGPLPPASKLVGLSLSGGGLRSACFTMGVVQALHRTGLWRFIDYLSTVSGGGYTGGHLTSTSLRDQQPFTEQNFPFREESGHQQPAGIQRLIYGGHYLLQSWLLFNKWLIGVVLINLAVFSGMFTVCALAAVAWRALDFPWVRDRAELLGWGDDLMAPFWPACFFLGAWLLAWLLSFYRRGSEASGKYARCFLYLAVPSLLIGMALLVGNGDIAGGSTMKRLLGKEAFSIRAEVWGPVVALILAGLLPLLRPQRLLQSGLRPQKKWERAIFLTASTALLVGLPLCLVGILSRENISGYNTCPYRKLVRQDIPDWPSLLAVIMPHRDDEVRGEQQEKGEAIRESFVRMSDAEPHGLSGLRTWPRRRVLSALQELSREPCEDGDRRLSEATYLPAVAQVIRAGPASPDFDKLLPDAPENGDPLEHYLAAVRDYWGCEGGERPPDSRLAELLDGPSGNSGGERFATAHPWASLYLRSWELAHVLDAFQRRQRAVFEEARDYPRSFWQPVSGMLYRVYHVAGWMVGDTNRVSEYWNAKIRQETLQQQIVDVLNRHVLGDRILLDRQLEILRSRVELAESFGPLEAGGREFEARLAETLEDSQAAYDANLPGLVAKARRAGAFHVPTQDVPRLNRLLLEHSFPNIFRPRSEIRRLVSIEQDQWTRLKWFVASLLLFLICGCLDLNAVSMHGYYRERLVQAFLVGKPGKSSAVPLSQIDATLYGSPYHLISCTVSVPGACRSQSEPDATAAEELETPPRDPHSFSPDGQTSEPSACPLADSSLLANARHEQACPEVNETWLDSFLMSSRYCGSRLTGYVATTECERLVRGDLNRLTLAEAIALSGAAISPGHSNNRLVIFLMMVLNFRLGQWLPNPLVKPARSRPRVLNLLVSMLQHPRQRPYYFVTDGGISENLGLVQLLSRRCRLIFAVDAGHDPQHEFTDLAKVMRLARIHGGVQLLKLAGDPLPQPDGDSFENEIQPDALALPAAGPPTGDGDRRDESTRRRGTADHLLLARILYPDAEPGLLVYIKPSLTGDEPLDLLEYGRQNQEFPHESTTDQVYEPEQVESYRRLGYHIGTRVGRLFPRIRQGATLWHEDWTADDLCREILGQLRGAAGDSPPLQGQATRETPPSPRPAPDTASGEAERAVSSGADRLLHLLREHWPDCSEFALGQLHDVLADDDRLAEWTEADVIQSLRTILGDRNRAATDRQFAVRWLLQLEAAQSPRAARPQTVECVCESLRSDEDEAVRVACVEALAILGQPASLRELAHAAVLAARTGDASSRVRWQAQIALHHLERGSSPPAERPPAKRRK